MCPDTNTRSCIQIRCAEQEQHGTVHAIDIYVSDVNRNVKASIGVVTCIILVLNHTLRRQRRLKGAYVPYQVRLRTFQFSVRLGALEETGKLQFRRHIEKRSHIQARMPPAICDWKLTAHLVSSSVEELSGLHPPSAGDRVRFCESIFGFPSQSSSLFNKKT